jgi:hypothetical protein
MRNGVGFRVFDRANWQRKARTPAWYRRAESEKRSTPPTDQKVSEKW